MRVRVQGLVSVRGSSLRGSCDGDTGVPRDSGHASPLHCRLVQCTQAQTYRGTLLIRRIPLGPYRMPMPKVLGGS